MPVTGACPSGTHRLYSAVSRSMSPSREPPSTTAVRATGSTATPRMSDKSSVIPPSASPRLACEAGRVEVWVWRKCEGGEPCCA
eukprot:143123-Chlamydomonas_euryale.AAC.1